MVHLFQIRQPFIIIIIVQFIFKSGYSQTFCSYRVPVPDLGICDASGGIEENINSGVYEVKGYIDGMQEYQLDNFKLFDQQLNGAENQRQKVDTELLDIAGELNTLKTALGTIQNKQTHWNSTPTSSSHRGKRAISSNSQLLQDLNTAKQSFQQSVISLEAKLQNLAKQAVIYDTQSQAVYTTYQNQLTKNQQDLTAAEAQLTTIATAVQQLVNSPSVLGSAPTAGLSQISQDVTDLVIDGRTAEMVAQRQIDIVGKELQTTETVERRVAIDLQPTTSKLNNTATRLDKVIQDTVAVKSADQIFEDKVGDFVANNTVDITTAKDLLRNATQDLAQLGQKVFQQSINENNLKRDLTAFRKVVDSVQSLVTYSSGVSLSQSTDILNLRKTLTDDINLLQFVFGARATLP